jgi:hypothetical protein
VLSGLQAFRVAPECRDVAAAAAAAAVAAVFWIMEQSNKIHGATHEDQESRVVPTTSIYLTCFHQLLQTEALCHSLAMGLLSHNRQLLPDHSTPHASPLGAAQETLIFNLV